MSVYNRKLFFNRGGQVNARGTGITSGLVQPVQKFQEGGSVIDPMAKARAAFNAGLMSGRSRNAGPIGSFVDIVGQAQGAAIEYIPDPKEKPTRVKRVFVFLNDWSIGQIIMMGTKTITGWKKGDVMFFDWRNTPHYTANCGVHHRPLLKITGTLSDDSWVFEGKEKGKIKKFKL